MRRGKSRLAHARTAAAAAGRGRGEAGSGGEAPGKATWLPLVSRGALEEVSGARGLLHAAMGGVGEPGRGPGPREGPAQLGATLPTFCWEQIRPHDLPGDKWLVIERRVYDISRWAQRHPGGSRLIGHHGGEDATVRKPTAGARRGLIREQCAQPCLRGLSILPALADL